MDIGAHTTTHPVLTRISDEAAGDEITGSKKWLEACLGRPVIAFAYPYGEYSARDVEIVRRAGFEIAFSTEAQAATAGCDRLQVPRVPVGHWNGADLERDITRLMGTSVRPPSVEARKVHFGDLRRLTPISRDWGFDRGTPIDRHYIERFLEHRAAAIRGHVLEMEEPRYTKMFGGVRVVHCDVLDVRGGAGAKYTCRLEEGDEIPADTFDCVVCTEVIQYIYDVRGALRTIHRILKPGGCLLLTVPGITPLPSGNEYGDAWHWCFTVPSISRLCGDIFGREALAVEAFGNILAATAFLYGLSSSELTQDELDHFDSDYTVKIGVQAVK